MPKSEIPPGLLVLPVADDILGDTPPENFHFDAEAGTLRVEIPGYCKIVATGVRQLELYKNHLQDSRLTPQDEYALPNGIPLRIIKDVA